MGHVTWPHPFQGRFVIRRLGLAVFNPHIKFEMSRITCSEDMKGNAECKNSRFEPPFGDLGVTHRVYLWPLRSYSVRLDLITACTVVQAVVKATSQSNGKAKF